MMVVAAGGTGGFQNLEWLQHTGGMLGVIVPAMPVAALQHLTSMWKPGLADEFSTFENVFENEYKAKVYFEAFTVAP